MNYWNKKTRKDDFSSFLLNYLLEEETLDTRIKEIVDRIESGIQKNRMQYPYSNDPRFFGLCREDIVSLRDYEIPLVIEECKRRGIPIVL